MIYRVVADPSDGPFADCGPAYRAARMPGGLGVAQRKRTEEGGLVNRAKKEAVAKLRRLQMAQRVVVGILADAAALNNTEDGDPVFLRPGLPPGRATPLPPNPCSQPASRTEQRPDDDGGRLGDGVE